MKFVLTQKIYAVNKKIRIIYQVKNDVLVVFVIAIGKRENKEVYWEAEQRIK